jgi:thiamine kinase-like enzyme
MYEIKEIKTSKIGITNISPLLEGSLNYKYCGEYNGKKVILKVYNKKFSDYKERFSNELNVLGNPINIEVPKILKYSKKEFWILCEWVDGKSLKKIEQENGKINLSSLVNYLKKIHSIAYGIISPEEYLDQRISILEKKLKQAEIEDPLFSSIKRGIEFLKKESKKIKLDNLCRVHGDLNGGNILFDIEGNVKSVVDWEFSHFGSPYIDLAQLTNRGTDMDKEILKEYFGNKLNKRLYEFFLVYFLLRIIIGNSGNNRLKMAYISKEKDKIIKNKIKRVMEMF